MSTRQQDIAQELTDDQLIADYLRSHPEFFNNHARLLTEIRVPHHAHGAVSLIERQVTALREHNLELKRQLQALVQVARDNDRLNERIQRFTLRLFEAADFDATLHAVNAGLRDDFQADMLALCLFRRAPAAAAAARPLPLRETDADDPDSAAFATLLATGKPLCGHLRRGQSAYLFGEQAEQLGSAVVLALNADSAEGPVRLGLLGIGSHDAKRYHAGMGTLFLSHLGDLVGRALDRHLPRTSR